MADLCQRQAVILYQASQFHNRATCESIMSVIEILPNVCVITEEFRKSWQNHGKKYHIQLLC